MTRALMFVAAAAAFVALALFVTGGTEFRIGSVLIRAHDPLIACVVAAAALVLVLTRGPAQFKAASTWWWAFVERSAAPLACAIALIAVATGWIWGTRVAGGSDSYCYLGQAELLASGRARQLQRIAANLPWADHKWSFVPAGYAPAPGPDGAIVPICPAGYPLLMVPARAIAGRTGMFLIVPLMGGVAVWMTFLLGRRIGGPIAGLMAAVLLAASPVFLYQIVQPMSDVPALALWIAALVLARRAVTTPGFAATMLSGAAAGAALVVRPNLVPLALVTGLWIAAERRRSIRAVFASLVAFGAGALPFVLVVMGVQNAMYGGPLRSGYGDLDALFRADRVWPNIMRYPRWLLQTETPLVLLALAAPFMAAAGTSRRERWWLLAFAAATIACYLPYIVFDAWWYLRFVLPAVAVLLALSAAVAIGLVARAPEVWRAPLFALACGLMVLVYLHIAVRRQAFELRDLESRYRIVGEYAAAHLPAEAAVVTVHESGSVRFYTGRPTLVWSEVPPSSIDPALDYLRSRGYRPYLLFEIWEEAGFRKRFEGQSALAGLDWPPIADINHEIRIYDPDDYQRLRSGTPVLTDRVWTKR